MNVLITGGGGFLGRRLAERLTQRGRLQGPDGRDQPIDRLTVLDIASGDPFDDPRVVQLTGDLADAGVLRRALDPDTTSVFHLAAIVSGMAEANFDLGMRINLDATRMLLEACRSASPAIRLVFTSSVAVYGGDLPATVLESTAVLPQTSYGSQKAIAELLVSDYTRRGFVDGRVLRLPTITVRPGRPNAAASSFASGIIREPLNGEPAVCPVGKDARLWVMSPATVIDCLVAAHETRAEAFGSSRILNLPGLSVTVGEMVDSLERVAGPEPVGRIRWEPDPRIARMVASWPGACDAERARALGFPTDDNFDAIVRRYIEDELSH
jgi:nucleoside-diphosphate-sugar epimerase